MRVLAFGAMSARHLPRCPAPHGLLMVLLLSTELACRTTEQPAELPSPPGEAVEVAFEPPFARLEFLAALEPEASSLGTAVGGLSGIAWDDERQLLLAVSDDPGEHGPVRVLELRLVLPDGDTAGSLRPSGVIELTADGRPLPRGGVDAEDLALTADGRLIVSSEGLRGTPPFVRFFARDGEQLAELALPDYLLPGDGRGVRPNLGLEAVSALQSGVVFAALENALAQDGPEARVDVGSRARILRWDAAGRRQEFVYRTDPVVDVPLEDGDFHTNGLVSILALDESRLLALERSYTVGFDNGIRLFLVELAGAEDVAGKESLPATAAEVDKVLLADLSALDFNLDNLEGLAWGPDLGDGRRTLLAISDDNFSQEQRTHLLIFAVSGETASIAEIQGASHLSSLDGAWLFGVEGVVTGVREAVEGPSSAWIQSDDDSDLATSSGLRLDYDAATFEFEPTQRVRVDGRLVEVGRQGELPVTTLQVTGIHNLGASTRPLPVGLDPRATANDLAVRHFAELPLDDDGFETFDLSASAIDLLESLEGMLVTLPPSTAVSGTSAYGEIALLPDGADGLRSPAGGVVLTPESFNPQRLIAIGTTDAPAPTVQVGDRFEAPISGVLDYSFGNYKLVVEEWPPVATRQRTAPPTVPWSAGKDDFTFATYNVLNLDPGDADAPTGDQFARLAASIVAGLASPDVIALQEVQDDNGPEDEGVTSAAQTLEMLVAAVVEAGGPRYAWTQIDPTHDGEGGQPVGNIRVAYLYRVDRVDIAERGLGGTFDSVAISGAGRFSLSPGRVAVDHPAFAGDEVRGWQGGRRCLAAEFKINSESWSFVNCHLKSKRGDDRLFGSTQPPVFHTEVQRSAQAEVLATLSRQILEADPNTRLVVLGDTNEHEFRRPVRILTASGLVNLIDRVPRGDRYTYNFNGNSQVLDNVLVSPGVEACSPEVAIVHWNTDLPDAERASDHDPVVVRVPDCR